MAGGILRTTAELSSAIPIVGRRGDLVATFPFELTAADRLRLSVKCADNTTITVAWRLIRPDGSIQVNSTDRVATGGRVYRSFSIDPGEGFITNVLVGSLVSDDQLGSVYARVQVMRGDSDAGVVIGTLVQGFPGIGNELFWPGGQSFLPNEGPGFRTFQTATAPAAGVNVSITVPSGARWKLRSIAIPFTASGIAATRRPYLDFKNGVFPSFIRIPAVVDCTAGAATVYCWAEGCAQDTQARFAGPIAPLPLDFALLNGWMIQTAVENLQAGDQWGIPMYVYDEWLMGA